MFGADAPGHVDPEPPPHAHEGVARRAAARAARRAEPEPEPEPEGTAIIKQRGDTYWITARSKDDARARAAKYGTVTRSRWSGPGHYRSDVYIVDTEPAAAEPEPAAIDLDNGATRMAREVREAFTN